MFSRRRLIVKGLKLEDFKCDFSSAEEEPTCDDCGVLIKGPVQYIGKRIFCKDCAPWYREEESKDEKALDEDLKRHGVMNIKELHYNDYDYWD